MGFFYKAKDDKIVLDEQWEKLVVAGRDLKKVLMKEFVEPVCRPFLDFLLWLIKRQGGKK
jgi:hypothetical protein